MPRLSEFTSDRPKRLSDYVEHDTAKLAREMTHRPQVEPEQTRAAQDLPELGQGGLLSGEDQAKVAAISPVLLATTDPAELSQIIRSNFPNIAQQQDEAGNEILANQKTGAQVIVNRPGLSKLDVLQGLGIISAFTPAGKMSTLAAGTGGKVALGALGAGATEAAIQSAQAGAGGEFSGGDVAMASAMGGAGELVQPLGQKIKEVRHAKRLRTERGAIREVQKELARGQRAQEVTGVGLFPAQKTLDPFALEEQSFLGSLPAAARKARRALLKQNRQVGRAVDDFLDEIAPLRSSADEDVRNIAGDIIANAKLARTKQTSPLFKRAFSQKKVVNVDDVLGNIEEELKQYGKGRIQSLLNRVKNQIDDAAKPVDGSNLQRLHNVKRSIWAEIERYEQGGKALDAEIKRKLTDAYGDIVGKLRKTSRPYADALDQFIEKSPEVTRLQKGKIGQIAKIKEDNLKSVTGRIFDAGETNPKIIRETRKLISEVDPDAWSAIVRTEAQKRLKNIDFDVTQLTPDNAPAKIKRALFGSGNKRRILLESLDPEQRMNALYLENALERASKGRPGGSQTGIRQVITDKLSGIGLAVRRFLKSPIERTLSTGEESAFNRSAEKLAEIMYDPKWKPRVTKLRKMREPRASYKATLQLLNDVSGAEGVNEKDDQPRTAQ